MQTTTDRQLIEQEKDIYFQRFIAVNGEEFGLRFATSQDTKAISMIFKEIYNYNYAYPIVYDINHLRKELSNKKQIWVVGESLDNKEIAGMALIETKRYIAHASQLNVKKKYQGLGISARLGAAGLMHLLKMPQFKNTLRLDCETRGTQIRAQKAIQNAGAIPFSLIPAYINWGDKRSFKIDFNSPVPPMQEESSIFYSIIFKKMWNNREKDVYLLNNEDIIFFYNYVKSQLKKMNKDILILEDTRKNKKYELYGVSKDYYEGRVNLYGYIKEKSLNHLLKTYRDWRLIIWRIPTTKNGISSMSLAIDKGFKSVGYDVGFNNINWTLFDSVIFVYHPNGFQSLDVNCLDEVKPLVKKIKELFSS